MLVDDALLTMLTAIESGDPRAAGEAITAWATPGRQTLAGLKPGLEAMLARLEYGATKHPDDAWKREACGDHIAALLRHVEKLKAACIDRTFDELLADLAKQPGVEVVHRPEVDRDAIRRHLASIACRALMMITVEENRCPSSPPSS